VCPINQNVSPVLKAALASLRTSGNTFDVFFHDQTGSVSYNTLDSFDCRFGSALDSDDAVVTFSLAAIDSIVDTGA
jgi:hypothetical protein